MLDRSLRDDTTELAFEFFYWFSRFEYSLKEQRFLKWKNVDDKAHPDWGDFINKFEESYPPSTAAAELNALYPKTQLVAEHSFKWHGEPMPGGWSELRKVVKHLNVVRDNLFHGGKSGPGDWDSPDRMRLILLASIRALKDLADFATFPIVFVGYIEQ